MSEIVLHICNWRCLFVKLRYENCVACLRNCVICLEIVAVCLNELGYIFKILCQVLCLFEKLSYVCVTLRSIY